MGAALVPVIGGDRWFESGSLIRLFDEELVIDTSYYLVYDTDRAKDKSVARRPRDPFTLMTIGKHNPGSGNCGELSACRTAWSTPAIC